MNSINDLLFNSRRKKSVPALKQLVL